MSKKKKTMVLVVIALFIFLPIGMIYCRYYIVRNKLSNIDLRRADPAKREQLVLLLLKQCLRDENNWLKRDHLYHVLEPLPLSISDRIFPIAYAKEKLLSQGSVAVEPLLKIANDSDQNRWIIKCAWLMLAKFDDPQITKSALNAAINKCITPYTLCLILNTHLRGTGREFDKDNVIEYLKEKLATKTYDEMRLDLLDELMKAPAEKGGLQVGIDNPDVLRWLNHLYHHDLDQWLTEKAPAALDFRNRELKKGYDPVIAFWMFPRNLSEGIIDEGIKAVFTDHDERKACRQLIQAVYDSMYFDSPFYISDQDDPNGLDELRKWYWENRDKFVYDFDKHRFVVKEKEQ
jgi:hypothetical protein